MDIDWALIELLYLIQSKFNNDLKVLWVLSKSDKLKQKARADTYNKTLHELDCDPNQLVYFSALNGQGVVEIRKLIMEILNG